MSRTSLVLHAGANAATIEQVSEVITPASTETWTPVPHIQLVQSVERALVGGGYKVQSSEFGLWKDGLRFFGLLNLINGQNAPDYQLTIGLRNSHDMAFSAGMAVGSRVFVCDNLAFSAEIVVSRKHTNKILGDLDRLVVTAIGRIGEARQSQDLRIAAYKAQEVTDAQVHDLLVRSIDAKIIANAMLPKVLKEYREPRHEEFKPRTGWSLFNSYTEVLKEINPFDRTQRTQRLHGLLDLASGLRAEPIIDAEFEVVEQPNLN